jgi:hypothetical protein
VHQGGLPSNSSPSGFSGASPLKFTGLSGEPPDSVRCSREKRLRTSQLRENGRPLRYNSLDCPVCQRNNGYFAPTIDSDSEQCGTVHETEVRAEDQRGTGLFGAAPDCPVPHEDKAFNGRPGPTSTDRMTWLAHRTLSGAPIASSLLQRLQIGWWL